MTNTTDDLWNIEVPFDDHEIDLDELTSEEPVDESALIADLRKSFGLCAEQE